MTTVTDVLNELEDIKRVYSCELYDDLIEKMNELATFFQAELEEQCKYKNMTMSNSVYNELYPFTLVYRVKASSSLKEKLIRSDLYSKVRNKDEVRIKENIIQHFDDLIGFTIQLDTSYYLDSFRDAIIEIAEKSETITLCEKNKEIKKREIGHLEYYNLKLNYEKNGFKVNFEVQIKSAMVSAFTNMEHKLMYKNNKVMISKENSKQMLKSVTPVIVAAESVLDTTLNSIEDYKQQQENFKRKEKIQSLINFGHEDKDIFSSFIEGIDKIVYKASKGYILYHEQTINEFWEVYQKQNININIENDNIFKSILYSILNVNIEFWKNILFYEYQKNSSEDYKDLFGEHMILFEVVLEKDSDIIEKLYYESESIKTIVIDSIQKTSESIEVLKDTFEEYIDDDETEKLKEEIFELFFKSIIKKEEYSDDKKLEKIVSDDKVYKSELLDILRKHLLEVQFEEGNQK